MFFQVFFANIEYIVGAFSIWFFTRHTHGKWPWQWHKFGRFDKLGFGK